MRKTDEWIADHDDQAIPVRVKLRIWEREGGKCHLTGKKIMPADKFEYEHRIALCNGGEHRETNIAVALKAPHKKKTKKDRNLKKKTDRLKKKHFGLNRKAKSRITRRYNRDTGQWQAYDNHKQEFIGGNGE
ncbi:MAG: HNH endonuclease [Methyloligellaceae bacterium]